MRGFRTSPYPYDDLLYTIKSRGGKVTLSSASHSADTLDFWADKARNMLKDIGFKYIDYSFCMEYNNKTGFFGSDENHLECVRICAKLGIPTLVVHTGYARSLTKEETYQKNKEFFAPMLEVAEKQGVYILAEGLLYEIGKSILTAYNCFEE